MYINKEVTGNVVTLIPVGRLDTTTSPMLEKELSELYSSAEKMIIDFKGLDYISSAGLRVLLSAQKVMKAKGGLVITNVNDIVSEVFEVTGFADILDIE